MQIIEEKVVLKGVEFTKTELLEIESFIALDPTDHVTLYLKDPVDSEQEVEVKDSSGKLVSLQKRKIPFSQKVRSSQALQKALRANLFLSFSFDSAITLSSELSNAIQYYRGKNK